MKTKHTQKLCNLPDYSTKINVRKQTNKWNEMNGWEKHEKSGPNICQPKSIQ